MQQMTNPTLAPYAKTGEVEFRLTAKAETVEKAEAMIAPWENKVREILGDFVYAEGENQSLQQTVVELLLQKGMTVATAESCTGGLVAKKLTEISGSSEVFHCGAVTYANHEKERLLGVKHETLAAYGAVSEQTALEMSQGIRQRAGADIGIGITGIAGPGGGTEEKPVGLVYVSICTEDDHLAYRLQLSGDRDMVRERASMYALDLVRRAVLGILTKEYIW